MRIKPKVTLFSSLFLIVVIAVLTVLTAWNIKVQGEERIASYRESAIKDVKLHLKDLVDVAYETVDQGYSNLNNLDYLSRYYEVRLNDILDTGETIIDRYQQRVATGELRIRQAKLEAMAEIKELRFDGGTGYIWINDTSRPYPTMVMHPTVPALDGVVLDSPKYNNALGKDQNLFVAALNATRNGQDGYIDYLWPKPTANGLTAKEPKLSYVRRYEDWGWILGTGIYLDDAEAEIKNRVLETVKSMRYANGTGYFWINDDTAPYPKMVMHPTVPSLDGEVLDNPKYNNALGSDKNLFTAFVEITAESPENDGFVDYLWPKPTENGLTEETDKVSYVVLHKGLGWIIGSGAYIDNIDQAVAEKYKEISAQVSKVISNSILAALVFIALAVVVSFLFSKSFARPIENLTRVADEISHGKNLEEPIEEVNRKDEIGDLAKSVERLKSSVRIMMDRMKRKKTENS